MWIRVTDAICPSGRCCNAEAQSEKDRVIYSAGKETVAEEGIEFSASLDQGTTSWGWVGMLTVLYAINRFQIGQGSQLGFQWGVC